MRRGVPGRPACKRPRPVLAVTTGPGVPARVVARAGRGCGADPDGSIADGGAHGAFRALPGVRARPVGGHRPRLRGPGGAVRGRTGARRARAPDAGGGDGRGAAGVGGGVGERDAELRGQRAGLAALLLRRGRRRDRPVAGRAGGHRAEALLAAPGDRQGPGGRAARLLRPPNDARPARLRGDHHPPAPRPAPGRGGGPEAGGHRLAGRRAGRGGQGRPGRPAPVAGRRRRGHRRLPQPRASGQRPTTGVPAGQGAVRADGGGHRRLDGAAGLPAGGRGRGRPAPPAPHRGLRDGGRTGPAGRDRPGAAAPEPAVQRHLRPGGPRPPAPAGPALARGWAR